MLTKLKNLFWPCIKVRSESVHIHVETVDGAPTAMLQVVVRAPRDVIEALERVVSNDVYNTLQRAPSKVRSDEDFNSIASTLNLIGSLKQSPGSVQHVKAPSEQHKEAA